MKTILERTAWMNKFEGTIPVGEGRRFTEDGTLYTAETWVNNHLHRSQDSKVTAEDVKEIGEFTAKMVWVVNCRYGVIPDENGKDTYTNALLKLFGFSTVKTTEEQKAPKNALSVPTYKARDTLLIR